MGLADDGGLRFDAYVEGLVSVIGKGQKSGQSGGGATMPDDCWQVWDLGLVWHCQA